MSLALILQWLTGCPCNTISFWPRYCPCLHLGPLRNDLCFNQCSLTIWPRSHVKQVGTKIDELGFMPVKKILGRSEKQKQ